MNENIYLTKILKNCPKGWEFYSSVYGEVEFKTIKFEQLRPIERSVSKAGEHKKGVGECTLFPSKDQRDWSKFTAPWYKRKGSTLRR